MCIVACKYFKDYGWVGVKNRDRNYIPSITIKQSLRNGVERMLLWDDKTKYTEGLNEFGVCILSAAVATKKDEKEGSQNRGEDTQFYSPDGKKIRNALYESTIDNALKKCIELELPGNTIIFDKERCLLLEGGFESIRDKSQYKYKWKEIAKDETVVRTNHGIILSWLGYQKGIDKEQDLSRKSSDMRYEKTVEAIKKVKTPDEMMKCISDSSSDKDPQLNPCRKRTGKSGELFTTGQIQLNPNILTLSYKPLDSKIKFNWEKIDSPTSKTYFEIISTRDLVNESMGNFKNWYEKNK